MFTNPLHAPIYNNSYKVTVHQYAKVIFYTYVYSFLIIINMIKYKPPEEEYLYQ